MDKFNTHQVTMGIKKSIKQQNSKQKRHIAPKSKEFRSWILRKVIDNGKNNSLNIWILDNPKIWGTHLNRREVVMVWGEEGGEKTLKLSNLQQDTLNTTHCKTTSTYKRAHLIATVNHWPIGHRELPHNRPSTVTQTLAKMPEHRKN